MLKILWCYCFGKCYEIHVMFHLNVIFDEKSIISAQTPVHILLK